MKQIIRESAAGGLHKYVNPALTEQEKDGWRRMAIRKHVEQWQYMKHRDISGRF